MRARVRSLRARPNRRRRRRRRPASISESLAAETRSALEKLEGTVQSLGRKSTAQAFELGSVFEEAGKLLEDQTFKGWVKERCGYEDRTARLYRDVHRNLTPWRKRLVDHAVKPTVMFKLATGDEEQIETIVAEIEAGKPLKVKDVVERLKAGAGDDTGAGELGAWDRSGLSGLLAAAKVRAHEDAATFGRVVSSIRSDIVHVLAETPDGKRVSKKDLAEKVEYPARHAKAVLEALLRPPMAANVEIGTDGCVRRHRGEGPGVKQRNHGARRTGCSLDASAADATVVGRVLPKPMSGAAWLSTSRHMLGGSPHTELAENYHTI